jgi:hypothetical protein
VTGRCHALFDFMLINIYTLQNMITFQISDPKEEFNWHDANQNLTCFCSKKNSEFVCLKSYTHETETKIENKMGNSNFQQINTFFFLNEQFEKLGSSHFPRAQPQHGD